MFDQLGDTWPKHACFDRQYQKLVDTVVPILKKGADPKSATFQPFAKLAEMFGGEIGAGTTGIASGPAPRKPKTKQPQPAQPEHSVKRMDPMPGEILAIVGVIRDRQAGTARLRDLFAKLGQIGRKAFNLPAEGRAVHLTIVDGGGEPNESYTCVADAQIVGKGLKPGVMVWVRLVARVTPSVAIWVVEEIHAI